MVKTYILQFHPVKMYGIETLIGVSALPAAELRYSLNFRCIQHENCYHTHMPEPKGTSYRTNQSTNYIIEKTRKLYNCLRKNDCTC